ncbi:MAG: hypothetical protein Q7R52_05390 [archaeon]|nr:hypothetical protein [archaeon]
MEILDFKDITKSFYEIESFLGKEWINKQMNLIKSQKEINDPTKHNFLLKKQEYHPFILTWKNALEQYQKCINNKFLESSDDLIKISVLGDYLSQLDKIKVIDINRTITDTNPKEKLKQRFIDLKTYEKVQFELQVASIYSKSYDVSFIEETLTSRTPDLIIKTDNFEVQIECKKKEDFSFIEKENNEIWQGLSVNILNYLSIKQKNFLIILNFIKIPSRRFFKDYYKFIKYNIDSNKTGVYKNDFLNLNIEIIEIINPEEIISLDYLNKFKRDEYFVNEYHSFQSKEKNISNATLIKNPKIICIKTQFIPEKIKLVIDSLKKAKEQLIFDIPSLVYIEINPSNLQDSDFIKLEQELNKYFDEKPSAVVLTIPPTLIIESSGGRYSHKSKVIFNNKAKYPLNDFKIIGLPKENE